MKRAIRGQGSPLSSVSMHFARPSQVRLLLAVAAALLVSVPRFPCPGAKEVQPELTVAVAGNTQGSLEICGCPAKPAGGVARRAFILNRYREAGRSVLAVETGGFWVGEDALDAERAFTYLQALEAMDWGPVLLARTEFQHGRTSLEALLSGSSLPFLATNVEDASGAPIPWRHDWIGEIAGFHVGVLGVTSGATPELMLRDGLRASDPLDCLAENVPVLRSKVDVLLVVTDAEPQLAREMCDSISGIDLLITHGADLIYQKVGRTLQVFASYEGKYLRLVSVRRDRPEEKIKYAVREKFLDEDSPEDPAVRGLIDQWYAEVAARPTSAGTETFPVWEGADSKAVFVGADSCQPCHRKEYARWTTHAHKRAMISLLRRQRYFLPRCIPCHVTGYGGEGGFHGFRPDHPMAGVQCEACHGPGSLHASKPEQSPPVSTPTRATCEKCHDEENSPSFDPQFESYWESAKHSP